MSEYIVNMSGDWADKQGEKLTEIVRCRDCAHWATEARFTGMCVGKQFNPDGFCAWGKHKEGGE